MIPKLPAIALLFSFLFVSPLQAEEPEQWDGTINAVLQDYLDATNGEVAPSLVAETAEVVKTLLAQNSLVYLDETLKGVLGGMSFTIGTGPQTHGLAFGPEFLQSYRPGSLAHLTVLAHELWHFRDYLKDQEAFLRAKSDANELLLYEMDAIHVEGDFVRLVAAQKKPLPHFCQFVLDSYNADYLAGVVLYLKTESQPVFFDFTKWTRQWDPTRGDIEKALSAVSTYGTSLLSTYERLREPVAHRGYAAFVALTTFRKQLQLYVPLVLQKPEMTWGEVFAQFPGLDLCYKKILEYEGQDLEKWSLYKRGAIAYLESDLVASVR